MSPPPFFRLHYDSSAGGAWCPAKTIGAAEIVDVTMSASNSGTNDQDEYLEISLPRLSVITGILTQGRYGKGRGQVRDQQQKEENRLPLPLLLSFLYNIFSGVCRGLHGQVLASWSHGVPGVQGQHGESGERGSS